MEVLHDRNQESFSAANKRGMDQTCFRNGTKGLVRTIKHAMSWQEEWTSTCSMLPHHEQLWQQQYCPSRKRSHNKEIFGFVSETKETRRCDDLTSHTEYISGKTMKRSVGNGKETISVCKLLGMKGLVGR